MAYVLIGGHQDALEASLLMYYGMGYATAQTRYTPSALGGLIKHLPDGAPLWRDIGGPRAWSAEEQMLVQLEHRLRLLLWQPTEDGHNNRNQPEPVAPPPLAAEAAAAERRTERRVNRYLKRQSP